MRRYNNLLLLLVALWLPIQAASAVAMPFCRHAAERTGQAEVLLEGAHCHEQAAVTVEDTDHVDGTLGCDNCEMCHLATAGYLPAAVTSLMPEAVSVLVALPALALPSHIGDPPQQPPRRLN